MRVIKPWGVLAAVVAIVVMLTLGTNKIRHASAMQAMVVSTTPATVTAGKGTPAANGIACSEGMASLTSTSLYDQRDITTGNSVWKCKVGPDDVTYAWQAPFTAATPTILGATTSFGGSLILLGSSVSSTATVTGATVGSNCIATRADGTLLAVGLVIDCAVTTANTATVRISALIAGTPSAGIYNVRVVL